MFANPSAHDTRNDRPYSRSNRIHPDRSRALFLRRRPRHPHDGMFARHIGAIVFDAHDAGDTGGVDNSPAAAAFEALLHVRQLRAEAIERALDVDVHDEVEFGVGDVSDGPALLGDAGPNGTGQIGGTGYRLSKVCPPCRRSTTGRPAASVHPPRL